MQDLGPISQAGAAGAELGGPLCRFQPAKKQMLMSCVRK